MKKIKLHLNRRDIILVVSIFFTVFLVGVGIYAAYIYNKANEAIDKMAAPHTTNQPSHEATPRKTFEATGIKKVEGLRPMTFMLTGVDSRDGSDGSMNTDVMMMVALNPQTSSATIISIPRDLEVKPGEFSAHKVNYFYPYYYNSDKTTAITNAKSFYSDLFGIHLDYMAVIDFQGFVQVVDELDGLKLDVDMDMKYVDHEDGTNINLMEGLQKLDGKNALDFVRYRKSNRGTAESSDFARNQRQQQVIKQLVDKLGSLNGLANLGDILEIVGSNVKTDIPADTLRTWIKSFQELKPDQIEFIHLEGEWESPYIVPKEEDLKAAIIAFKSRVSLTKGTSLEPEDLTSKIGLVPSS
ncbi:MAG: LCP family protein [Gorillibacterium sp.]|nr:LCP family protein [Gorillibacterium sp.]